MSRFPVQEIAVQVIGPEPLQAPFAGDHRSAAAGILGQYLRNEKDLVTAAADHLGHHLLDGAAAVQLCRINMAESEVEPSPQRRDRLTPRILLHLPGALADD